MFAICQVEIVVFLVGSLIMFRSVHMSMLNGPRRRTVADTNLFLRFKLSLLYQLLVQGWGSKTPFLLCKLAPYWDWPIEAQREMARLEEEEGAWSFLSALSPPKHFIPAEAGVSVIVIDTTQCSFLRCLPGTLVHKTSLLSPDTGINLIRGLECQLFVVSPSFKN